MFSKGDIVKFYYSCGDLGSVWRYLGYEYMYAEIFSQENHRTKRIGYLLDWKSKKGDLQFIPKEFGRNSIPINWYEGNEPITYKLTVYQANLLNLIEKSIKNGENVLAGELESIFPNLDVDQHGDYYTQLLDLRI